MSLLKSISSPPGNRHHTGIDKGLKRAVKTRFGETRSGNAVWPSPPAKSGDGARVTAARASSGTCRKLGEVPLESGPQMTLRHFHVSGDFNGGRNCGGAHQGPIPKGPPRRRAMWLR